MDPGLTMDCGSIYWNLQPLQDEWPSSPEVPIDFINPTITPMANDEIIDSMISNLEKIEAEDVLSPPASPSGSSMSGVSSDTLRSDPLLSSAVSTPLPFFDAEVSYSGMDFGDLPAMFTDGSSVSSDNSTHLLMEDIPNSAPVVSEPTKIIIARQSVPPKATVTGRFAKKKSPDEVRNLLPMTTKDIPSRIQKGVRGKKTSFTRFASKDHSRNFQAPISSLLTLSDEEIKLCEDEGIPIPSKLPLTKSEEAALRRIKRKAKNREFAKESRIRRNSYFDGLEKRVHDTTAENEQLKRQVDQLTKQNHSLINQLKRMQAALTNNSKRTAQTGTCLAVILLSFALLLTPGYESQTPGSGKGRQQGAMGNKQLLKALKRSPISGYSRTLLNHAIGDSDGQSNDAPGGGVDAEESPYFFTEDVGVVWTFCPTQSNDDQSFSTHLLLHWPGCYTMFSVSHPQHGKNVVVGDAMPSALGDSYFKVHDSQRHAKSSKEKEPITNKTAYRNGLASVRVSPPPRAGSKKEPLSKHQDFPTKIAPKRPFTETRFVSDDVVRPPQLKKQNISIVRLYPADVAMSRRPTPMMG